MTAHTIDEEVRREPEPAEHFATLEQESHATRLGMWVFLASEVLLFSALLTLYAYYRLAYPEQFSEGIHATDKLLGSLNTIVLITSSLAAALAVWSAEHGKAKGTVVGLAVTVALALLFLVFKVLEYSEHFKEGIWPGGHGRWIEEHGPGGANFFNLYYLLTGAHAVHVIAGMTVLTTMGVMFLRKKLRNPAVTIEIGVLYWHLVDIIWIFLWPLFYLTGHK